MPTLEHRNLTCLYPRLPQKSVSSMRTEEREGAGNACVCARRDTKSSVSISVTSESTDNSRQLQLQYGNAAAVGTYSFTSPPTIYRNDNSSILHSVLLVASNDHLQFRTSCVSFEGTAEHLAICHVIMTTSLGSNFTCNSDRSKHIEK